MKKTITTLFFLLAIAGFVTAQDNSSVDLEIPVLQRDLSPSIASIEIMSNLGDSTFIGILPSEYPNVRTNVIISKGVQRWLQEYVGQAFSSSFDTSGKKALWVFNALRVGKDSSNAGITSFVKLSADIYNNTLSGYQLENLFDTTLVSTDPNIDLGEELAIAINTLYDKSVANTSSAIKQQLQFSQIGNKPLTKSSLIQSLQAETNLKILSDSIYQTGVFKSFQEFIDNAPSITNFYTLVDSNSNQVQLYELTADSSSQLIANAWGISINNELYRYQDGQLYAIEKDGSSFTLSKYLDYRTRKNQAFFWRRYIGKRQGDDNPFNDAHVYRTALNINPSIKVEATQLNMATGTISID